MGFFSSLFGGPSQQQLGLAAQEQTMANTFNVDFQQRFANQNATLQSLNNQLTPIANLGPNAQGFSAPELAAMNTQAINEAGAAARNAAMTTGTALAGRGEGGTSGITSGIEAQIKGSEASAAANQLAAAQEAITQKNYDVGRQQFWNATQGEQALAGAYNPTAYGSLASSETGQALSAANQIQQEKQAAAMGPLSLATKAIGAGLGFVSGGLSNLGGSDTSFGENVGQFFQGGFQSLAG